MSATCSHLDSIHFAEVPASIAGFIGNILTGESKSTVDPAKFTEPAEKELWSSFTKNVAEPWTNGGEFKQPVSRAEYERLLSLLQKIAAAVDLFFDDVYGRDSEKMAVTGEAEKDLAAAGR